MRSTALSSIIIIKVCFRHAFLSKYTNLSAQPMPDYSSEFEMPLAVPRPTKMVHPFLLILSVSLDEHGAKVD